MDDACLAITQPKFYPQKLALKCQARYVCKSRTGEAETGGSPGHMASQTGLLSELRAKDDLASKWVGSASEEDPEFVLGLHTHGS